MSFSKKATILIFISVLVFTLFFIDDHKTNNRISVFYVPHPDDEVLSMGPGILKSLEGGEEVYLVLMTQGGGSNAIKSINNKIDNEISVDEFKEARVKEFLDASDKMGIKRENVLVLNYDDGQLTTEDSKEVITFFENLFSPKHHVMSYLDNHNDHKVMGQALKELDFNATYYVKRSMGLEGDFNKIHLSPEGRNKLNIALDAYTVWNPEEGRYAIGWNSVKNSFKQAYDVNFIEIH